MAPVLEAFLDATVVLAATRDCRPGLQKLWWAFERLDLPPLAREDAQALLWSTVDRSPPRRPRPLRGDRARAGGRQSPRDRRDDPADPGRRTGRRADDPSPPARRGPSLPRPDARPAPDRRRPGRHALRGARPRQSRPLRAGRDVRRALLRGPRRSSCGGSGDDGVSTTARDQPAPGKRRRNQSRGAATLHVSFSGGEARGYAHVGTLHAIERLGLRIVEVSGSSIGAFVAALVAAGYTASEITELGTTLRRRDFLRYTWPERRLAGEPLPASRPPAAAGLVDRGAVPADRGAAARACPLPRPPPAVHDPGDRPHARPAVLVQRRDHAGRGGRARGERLRRVADPHDPGRMGRPALCRRRRVRPAAPHPDPGRSRRSPRTCRATRRPARHRVPRPEPWPRTSRPGSARRAPCGGSGADRSRCSGTGRSSLGSRPSGGPRRPWSAVSSRTPRAWRVRVLAASGSERRPHA